MRYDASPPALGDRTAEPKPAGPSRPRTASDGLAPGVRQARRTGAISCSRRGCAGSTTACRTVPSRWRTSTRVGAPRRATSSVIAAGRSPALPGAADTRPPSTVATIHSGHRAPPGAKRIQASKISSDAVMPARCESPPRNPSRRLPLRLITPDRVRNPEHARCQFVSLPRVSNISSSLGWSWCWMRKALSLILHRACPIPRPGSSACSVPVRPRAWAAEPIWSVSCR